MRTKLEDVVRAVSEWAPDVLVSEDRDGNITLSLNMYLVDDTYLEPFTEGEDDFE